METEEQTIQRIAWNSTPTAQEIVREVQEQIKKKYLEMDK